MSRRTGRRWGAAVVTLATLTLTVGPLAEPAGSAPQYRAYASAGSVTLTKTVTRQHLDATGHAQPAEKKTVTVSIDRTQQLKGRQDINVSWKGAHPTGGVRPDLNATSAGLQEYPMMLVECRGVDSTRVAASKRVSPQTCWTHGSDVRYRGSSARFLAWRLDRYAAAADRHQYVNRPSHVPDSCGSQPASEYWLPFVAHDGKRYDYGNQSCAGLPPEDYNFDSSAQSVPQNVTFAPTATDGTGSVKFDVFTEAENASLGCSAAVDCTLEIVPIMGVSCDPAGKSLASRGIAQQDVPNENEVDAATQRCEASGQYPPGSYNSPSQGVDLAVSGALWWSASNWRNRIAVPLNFAPVSTACQQVGGGDQVSVYGSELMTEATAQWGPAFCLNPKLFKFTHVQTAEPLARTLISDPLSGVDAAFSSSPPANGFARPTVQAPVAVTGFSVSYNVDNTDRKAVTNLKLTPRLLAKLLTESYPGDDFDRFKPGQYPYLKGNPINVTQDPEFQALNPKISAGLDVAGASALIVPSAETDVTTALTSYIDADPAARAWLDGTPDPWGMKVNPAYKKIVLPLSRWPLLDTTIPTFTADNQCSTEDPAPWLPLLASPTPSLAATSINVQFAASPGRTVCTQSGDPNDPSNHYFQWSSAGRAQPGQRIVIGITSLGEAARYDLNSAALQSTSTVAPSEKFTSAAGRTFVKPSLAALAKAAAHLHRDDTRRLWTTPSGALAKDPRAYPGLMVINADIPTTGVKAARAHDLGNLLLFAAGRGQTVGTGNGDLPDGYLPMTRANGLGALIDYTVRAASAVRAQRGAVPALVAPRTVRTRTTTSSNPPTLPISGSGGQGGLGSGSGGTGGTLGGLGGTPGDGQATGAPTGAGTSATPVAGKPGTSTPVSAAATPVAQTVATPGVPTGFGGVVLPLLLGAVMLGGLVAGGTVFGPQLRRKR